MELILKADFYILDLIQNYLRCGFLDWLMVLFTRLGDSGVIWIVLTLMCLYSDKYRKLGAAMTFALVVALLLGNELLKELVKRPRPFTYTDIELLIPPPHGYSFPSGHTMASFSAATAVCLTQRRLGKWAAVLAVLISVSRMYLYVHFPTDVLCGAIFGVIFGYIGAAIIYRKIKF